VGQKNYCEKIFPLKKLCINLNIEQNESKKDLKLVTITSDSCKFPQQLIFLPLVCFPFEASLRGKFAANGWK
jgi:hypothetical protein